MKRVASLTGQYWRKRHVIHYGAPKLKALNARSTLQPNRYEWDITQIVENIEKDFMSKLYNQFQRARTAIQSCKKVYRCLDRICILVTES
jgi:hypothetical protein